MGLVEITAFLKALPKLVDIGERLLNKMDQVYLEKKNAELDEFKGEMYAELDKLILAKDDNARKAGIVNLSKLIAGKRVQG